LIVPSAIVVPRDASAALALFGSVNAHDSLFPSAFERTNLALNRIVDLLSRSVARFIDPNPTRQKSFAGSARRFDESLCQLFSKRPYQPPPGVTGEIIAPQPRQAVAMSQNLPAGWKAESPSANTNASPDKWDRSAREAS
jgi:hypothetical protein